MTDEQIYDWFYGLDSIQMERIFKVSRHDFDTENGFSDFEEHCHRIWSVIGSDKRREIYNENN